MSPSFTPSHTPSPPLAWTCPVTGLGCESINCYIHGIHCKEQSTVAAMEIRTLPTASSATDAPLTGVAATLAPRGTRYGDFTDNAAYSQDLKQAISYHPNWVCLDAVKKEALEMIAQKIARILNGDPNYKDNWHDIAGYATLAEERCSSEGEQQL